MTKGSNIATVRKAAKRAVDLALSKDPGPKRCYCIITTGGQSETQGAMSGSGWTVSKVLDDVIEAFLIEAEYDGR